MNRRILAVYLTICALIVWTQPAESMNPACNAQNIHAIANGGTLYVPGSCGLELTESIVIQGNVILKADRLMLSGVSPSFVVLPGANLTLHNVQTR